MTIELTPVGRVRSARAEVLDDDWDAVEAAIELDAAQFGPDALAQIEAFSHLEVVFLFDRVPAGRVERGARRPRGNPAWPEVGIFAQRGKNRPNRLGVTVCALEGVDGLTLRVRGLDAVDGTPVLDIKPWMAEFGPRGPVRQPSWATELMAGYWG
ncbi:SAM-dependent methyltransferase [Georgenia thermotolerans]|uniref:tRNA (N6-threonylcarbamoyladenosine(37)-N6)-methyltransferase TrmO n=1 Tax=Georgenia thermotolerans TaxID=527326 RepID=A0A7J5UPE0_9MICO|nr:SAM-dependent methyltransferase [Georgenia thermotolerans]KAE8763974.1 tRNA (N6-threonylcarbamoyladenosine(37)-N6)-methyltransferase TrmO [Georgenia thermotolerans]